MHAVDSNKNGDTNYTLVLPCMSKNNSLSISLIIIIIVSVYVFVHSLIIYSHLILLFDLIFLVIMDCSFEFI